ncbi:MAG: hypothetical protein MJ252_21990 [archaeon]|nr:hypothetical protein [archaeon]
MEKKLKDYQRVVESLRGYNDDLDSYEAREYFNYKSDIHENIENANKLPEEIRGLSDQIDDLDIKRADLLQKKDQKEKILKKMEVIEDEVRELVTRVQQKEKRFEGMQENEANAGGMQRADSIGGQMKLITLQKNSEALEQRRKELEQVKQASAEVNQLTEVMKQEIYQQGDMLNDIEANVDKTETNINKAQQQIKEADKLQQDAGKRTRCFILIVLGVVAAIVAIALCIYFGKK